MPPKFGFARVESKPDFQERLFSLLNQMLILRQNSTEEPLTANELILLKQITRIVAIAVKYFIEADQDT